MNKTLVLLAAAALVAACEKKDDGNEGGDTSPPEVVSTDPASGGTASVSAAISATFSEPLDPATVTTTTFRLSSGSTLVAGVVSYADDTATFTPTSSLLGSVEYTAQILDDVTDEAGNALESAYSWSFTTSAGEFALSSTAFAPGSPIPDEYTCYGANSSPALAWTAGPPGTLSYAFVLTDLDNGLIHSILFDIEASTTSLIQGIPNTANPTPPGGGAKQVKAYDNTTYGYLGPCPPNEHTYEFAVYAIDVATLPGVTTASTRAQVFTAIGMHDLDSASFTGTFAPP